MSWSPSTDNKRLAGYYVLVDGTPSHGAGDDGVVAGLAPGTTYDVQVQAFDARLNVSALSSAVAGTTTADGRRRPRPPTGGPRREHLRSDHRLESVDR